MLDLVRGIKKLSSVEDINDIDESDFFRTMDEEDKKNMMIKEILEVFPDKKRDSIEKAIDIKKKIELFAELFLPDDIGEPGGSGFSLSSLANFSNLGSLGNLKLLGNLLRGDSYSKNSNDSYIGKQKESGATIEKFANTPQNCFIDNGDINGKTIPDKLNKQWYIDLAIKRIEDFDEMKLV
jgi:hypothetical protein